MKTVMIIDDDLMTSTLLQEILFQCGYQVKLATSMLIGMEIFNSNKNIDLVICDINLTHEKSSLDLLIDIRERHGEIPFAFITGRTVSSDVEHSIQLGADDFITKPIDIDLFLAKIKRLLGDSGDSNEKTKLFSEKKLNRLGKADSAFVISKISEDGIYIDSPKPFLKNKKIKIKSDFFDELGIRSQWLRVNSCVQNESINDSYKANLSFIGLMDSETRKIRSWIIQHPDKVKYIESKKSAGH